MTPATDGKLSSEEVDALLAATKQVGLPGERAEPSRRVHRYDFTQPSRFDRASLEKLRAMHAPLSQHLTREGSRRLGTNVKAQLVSMEQMKWEGMLGEAGENVVAFIIEFDALGTKGLVLVDGPFAVACLEKMMGGSVEEQPEGPVVLSSIEVTLFRRLLASLLEPLPELWERLGSFAVQMGAYVQDLAELDLFPVTEDMFQISMLVEGSIASGRVGLCVPFATVKGLPPQEDEGDEESVLAQGVKGERRLHEGLRSARLELAVTLGSADVKADRLLRLKPQDVIVLDTTIRSPLQVRVNGKAKFQAYPGTTEGRLAAKLITG